MKQEKNVWDALLLLAIALFVAFCVSFGCTMVYGQDVVRKGDTFEQVSKKEKKFAGSIKTKYVYKDVDGITYPIYISKNKKVFIIKTSKNGKKRPKYLEKYLKEQTEVILKAYEN